MLVPFALSDEDLKLYIADFHIAREAFRRASQHQDPTKPIPLPPEEVMDLLYEDRSINLPFEAYAVEVANSQAHLADLIRASTRDWAGIGRRGTIDTHKGPIDALFYRGSDATGTIVLIGERVKGFDKYIEKSMLNVNGQNEAGHFDQKAARAIIEHPEAIEFRRVRPIRNLSRAEKKDFRKRYHRKSKLEELTQEERRDYEREFGKEFAGLSDKEKEEYRRRFTEGPNRDLCLSDAERLAKVNSIDSIPISPHYMLLKGLELRVQRQVIYDHKGNEVLEFEYILRSRQSRGNDFYNTVLESCKAVGYHGGGAQYIDSYGRRSHLIQSGDLLVNFHIIDPNSEIDINDLASRVQQNYAVAQRRFQIPERDPKKLTKDEVRELEEKIRKSESKIMEAIRLGMEDLPAIGDLPEVRFLILPETRTRDLEGFYDEMTLDMKKIRETFIKEETGPNKKPDTGYENVKVFVCLSPSTSHISGEFQFRDPAMDFHAEQGAGASYYNAREILRVTRQARTTAPITPLDERLKTAFFTQGEASDIELSRAFADFYSWSLKNLIMAVSALGPIPSEPESLERRTLDGLLGRLINLYEKARTRVSSDDLGRLASVMGPISKSYLDGKVGAPLIYDNNLRAVNAKVRKANSDLGTSFDHFETDEEIALFLHKKQIDFLYKVYEHLAGSEDVRKVAASFIVGQLVRRYNDYFEENLPDQVELNYRGRIDSFGKDRGWATYTSRGRQFGNIPTRMRGRINRLSDAVHDLSVLEEISGTPFGPIDDYTQERLRRARNKLTSVRT